MTATAPKTKTAASLAIILGFGLIGIGAVMAAAWFNLSTKQTTQKNQMRAPQTKHRAISATTLRTETFENGRLAKVEHQPLQVFGQKSPTVDQNDKYRPKPKGYIVKFSGASLIEKRKELRESGLTGTALNDAVRDYRSSLRRSQDDLTQRLATAVGKTTGTIAPVRYESGFNGVTIDNLKAAEAKQIEKLAGIEYIVPNVPVRVAQSNQAVTASGADYVLPADIQLPGYDGTGVTIAVLDTGVDYTHPDFGSCLLPPKTQTCFTPDPTTVGSCTDSDGGRNLCQPGFTSALENGYQTERFDYCERHRGPTALYEHTCAADGTAVSTLESCPGGCLDSQCIGADNILTPAACPKVPSGYDFVTCAEFDWWGDCLLPKAEDPDPRDDHGHGTHVASIAAGGGAIKGVAYGATIQAYKVLNSQGWGFTSWVLSGLERALDPNQDGDLNDRADVINISFGSTVDFPGRNPVTNAVEAAAGDGVIVAVAAGNGGWFGGIMSPGDAPGAIAIGATDRLAVPMFSSRGPVNRKEFAFKPDVVAPGVNVCAAQHGLYNQQFGQECIDDQHTILSGTSMAAPHAAGAAALLLQSRPSLTPTQLKSRLTLTGQPTVSTQYAGHIYDYPEFGNKVVGPEVCTKTDVPVPVANAEIQFVMPYENAAPIRALIRADADGMPGAIQQQLPFSRQGELGGFPLYTTMLPTLVSGTYWLCGVYDSPAQLNVRESGNWHTDMFYNPVSNLFEQPRNYYDEPTMINMFLALIYETPSSGLESGGGLINPVAANTVPIDVNPTAISFGAVAGAGPVEQSFTLTRNDSGRTPTVNARPARVVADLYRRSLFSDKEYSFVKVTSLKNKTYQATLAVPAGTPVGHYAGQIAISIGRATYYLPYSFVVTNESVLEVPPTNVIPDFDGRVTDEEWKDGAVIDMPDPSNPGRLYFKTGRYNGQDTLMIGSTITGQIDLPDNSCSNIGFNIFIDEGDDNGGGSGTFDRQLTYTQEDWKMHYLGICKIGGVIQPTISTRMDGYYTGGYSWTAWNSDLFDPTLGAFTAFQAAGQNEATAELAIPLQGVDRPEETGDDAGDMRVDYGNTVSFMIEFELPGLLPSWYMSYPSDGSIWRPETFRTKLHLATCNDGTLPYNCSASKPLYCAGTALVPKCSSCGCPTGQTCKTDGACGSSSGGGGSPKNPLEIPL